ncbi:MAG: response regulator [Kouleothrix sp.]|nr:response regulator [Kouleothrix sp.]
MQHPHILIVDNDPTAALVTQRGLQRLLDASKAEVEIAPSPGAAWLRCLREQVDLLIIDPSPESGAASALVKALHVDRPDIPVMVLTAYDTPRLRAQMRTLGVQNYLAKPVDLHDLGQAVQLVVGDSHAPAEH